MSLKHIFRSLNETFNAIESDLLSSGQSGINIYTIYELYMYSLSMS